MSTIIITLACVCVFLLLTGIFNIARSFSEAGRDRVAGRVARMAETGQAQKQVDIIRRAHYSDLGWLNKFLGGLSAVKDFDKTVKMAGLKGSAAQYLLMAAIFGVIGFYAANWFLNNTLMGLCAGFILGTLPVWRVYRAKARRMARFQTQLPDALELIARALKAGNTFPGGMRMVADEFDDPIGEEFKKTQDEINFGVSVNKALSNLMGRVECQDLKFFAVSVSIQRETGGNLAEIVDKIASLVRERFKLFGRIRILSAEGRLSAMILVALPFVIAFVIYLINPGYVSLLFTTPLGRAMIGGSLLLMVMGIFTIRRMIKIKV